MLLRRRLVVLLVVVGLRLRLRRGAGGLRARLQLLQGRLPRMGYVMCFLGIQRARCHGLVPVLILLVYRRPGRELQSIVGMVGQRRRGSYRAALVSTRQRAIRDRSPQSATPSMQRLPAAVGWLQGDCGGSQAVREGAGVLRAARSVQCAVCSGSAGVRRGQQGWVEALETDMLPPRNGSFPSFGSVVKQVRLGVCTDGMGPRPELPS